MKQWLIFGALFLAPFFFSFYYSPLNNEQFGVLAQSFLRGRVDIDLSYGPMSDVSYWNGKVFWPLGFFPAVLLVPGTWLFDGGGAIFYQAYIQVVLVCGVWFLLWYLARLHGYSKADSFLWAIAFGLGSVFLAVALWPWSWQFAQVVTVFFWLLAIVLSRRGKSWWLIGLCFSIILLTRQTAAVGAVYFAYLLVRTSKSRVRDLVRFSMPIIVSVAVLFVYNYLRFGSFFEQGYSTQLIPDFLEKARSYGLVGLAHLPGNIYYFLLAGPQPVVADSLSRVLRFPFLKADPWGIGLLWTSPYLIYVFVKQRMRWSEIVPEILTVVVIALPIFLYYGVGWKQAGYRYSLDFLPMMFLVAMKLLQGKRFSTMLTFLIVLSVGFNFLWWLTVFFTY